MGAIISIYPLDEKRLMFISDKIVFIHLQKTGGVHISQLLSKLLEGEKQPGHLQVDPEYHSRFIIGSMRNPWDWYVSLWAYGCAGKGGIHGWLSRLGRKGAGHG